MRILADENIEKEAIAAFRAAELEVLSIGESHTGCSDEEILRIAADNNAVILTYDTDFGELVFRFRLSSRGVILIRLGGLDLANRIEKTIRVIRDHESELENAFTVISEHSVRIRKSI